MNQPVVRSLEIAKQEFDLQSETYLLLNKRPKVSKNVLQAYHKEILSIAKAFKQLFMDIASRKQKYVSLLLQLEDDLQCNKTKEEQTYMDVTTQVDDLKKSLCLGLSEKQQLLKENGQLEDNIHEKELLKSTFQQTAAQNEATKSQLHSQLVSLQVTLKKLKDANDILLSQKSELTTTLEVEESGINSCATALDKQYEDRHSTLTTTIASNTDKYNALKEEFQKSKNIVIEHIEELNQSIITLQHDITDLTNQKNSKIESKTILQTKFLKEVEDMLKRLDDLTKEVDISTNEISQLMKQKADSDTYYNNKLEKISNEKKEIYDNLVKIEVEKTQIEGEKNRLLKNQQKCADDLKNEEIKNTELQERLKKANEEYEEGNEILTNGLRDVSAMKSQVDDLDKEIESVSNVLYSRNEQITAELEELAVQCEDLEDKVSEEGKGRNEEKLILNQELQALERIYNSLSTANVTLQSDYHNVLDMKNNTTESGNSRIVSLQAELARWKQKVQNTTSIEQQYQENQIRLKNLEEKVVRSEKTRRLLCDRIQTIKGNIMTEVLIHEVYPNGQYMIDVAPDESGIAIVGNGERSSIYTYDHIIWNNFNDSTIVDSLAEYLYSVVDGKTVTLLNFGSWSQSILKRDFLFDSSSSCLLYQVVNSLFLRNIKSESIKQQFQLYLSVAEIDAHIAGAHLQVDRQNTSVGETYVDDEPIIHDLLEISRFSCEMSTDNAIALKRREIRKEEDIEDFLNILCHQRSNMMSDPMKINEQLSMVVTLTVEGGDVNGRQTVGQIHFCDVTTVEPSALQLSNSAYDEMLFGLIPALDKLFLTTSTRQNDSILTTVSSLPDLLVRISNKGKIIVLNHLDAMIQDYDETTELLNFIQCISNCKLGPAQSRLL